MINGKFAIFYWQTLVARVALLVGIRGDRSTTTCFQYMQHKSALKIEQEIKYYKFDGNVFGPGALRAGLLDISDFIA